MDAHDLSAAMKSAAQLMHEPMDVPQMLQAIADAAAQTIPGVDQAGVSVAHRDGRMETLAGTGEFASAQELYASMRSSGSSVGLATVYRALQEMAGAGDLDTVRNQSGEVLYRQCAQPAHHHHLVCRDCGRTQEVKAPGVERWARTVGQEYGFVDLDHQVDLFGICADCASRTDRS